MATSTTQPVGRFGVLGWPVRHSRSPGIHSAAYHALGLDGLSYQLLPVPPALFIETVRALPAVGFLGANVTIPHKEAALLLSDSASVAATEIGAANTLIFSAEKGIVAHNTDAPGFIASLPIPVEGRSALVLGAGGSARAVVWALVSGGASDVAVWNRTSQRAEQLCQEVGGRVTDRTEPADLLINCTAVGLKEPEKTFELLPVERSQISDFECVIDLVYGKSELPLISEARRAGSKTVDGVQILVHQAALSFQLWTGLEAPIDAMNEAARKDPGS